jgi:solute carrier family 25 (mitochondrial thiamine pyrophosphate transporter), member 19
VIAGGVAGLVSRFVIAPLDVVKIRLQLQPHSLSDPLSCDGIKGPIYKGVFSTLRAIVRQEGIRALWKGNIPAEVMYVAYGGVQFTAYRSITQMQSFLPTRLPPSAESFVSGAGAGAVATTVTYPLDLLRTRFAAQGTERIYTGLLGSLQDIGRHEGPKGFFRGLSAAIGQIVPYMGLFFMSYEFLHQYIGGKTLPFGSGDATAGIFASVFAKTAVFPLDLVRKRLQVQGPTRARYIHTNIPEYNRGVLRALATIWRKEGYRGWYRGLTVSLVKVSRLLREASDGTDTGIVKAAPASAVTMWTYERVLHSLISTNRADEM